MILTKGKNWVSSRLHREADKWVKLRKNASTWSSSSDPRLDELVKQGCTLIPGLFSTDQVKKWIDIYGLEANNISPSKNNLTIPFVNAEIIKAIVDSPLSELLDRYFVKVYGKKPITQTCPHIVVAKTDFDQDRFRPGENRIPAIWHTDYPYELSVHIPLTRIDTETTRTKYAKGSHRSFRVWPNFSDQTLTDTEVSRRFELKDCFADPGDGLVLDVTGLHRAHLKESYRAIIQLKYTAGNQMLAYDDKNFEWLYKKTLGHWKDQSQVLATLRSDRDFLKKSNLGESLSIVKSYTRLYEQITQS